MNVRFFVFLAIVPAFASCAGTYHRARFNPPDGLNGQETFVVPFRESRRSPSLWYGDSRRGSWVVNSLRNWALEYADSYFVAGEAARQVLAAIREWPKERITAEDWRTLVAGLGIRYVVAGDIRSVQLRDEKMIGLYSPRVEAYYEVIDAERGKTIFDATPVVSFGQGDDPQVSFTHQMDQDSRIERRLLTSLGEQIGKDLYGYVGD